MLRNGIKCAHCGGQDFEVVVSAVPEGISLECNACGTTTPIAVCLDYSRVGGVNGPATSKLFDRCYCEDITNKELLDAVVTDAKQQGKECV